MSISKLLVYSKPQNTSHIKHKKFGGCDFNEFRVRVILHGLHVKFTLKMSQHHTAPVDGTRLCKSELRILSCFVSGCHAYEIFDFKVHETWYISVIKQILLKIYIDIYIFWYFMLLKLAVRGQSRRDEAQQDTEIISALFSINWEINRLDWCLLSTKDMFTALDVIC